MTNVLVTGSRGIVGRHFMRHLIGLGKIYTCFEFTGDLRSRSDIEETVRRLSRVDVVVNLAAIVAVNKVQEDPASAYAVNAGGVLNLLEVLKARKQSPYFFQCSTSHVYAPSSEPISETGLTDPRTIYGRTKLMAETIVRDVCPAVGFPFCIGRLFSIHDPYQTGSYLRPNIETRLREEDLSKPFELTGANSIRDFLTAENAAKLIATLVTNRLEGVMNIASGRGMKVKDFVQSLSLQSLEIIHKGEANTLVADTTRLNAALAAAGVLA